MNYLTHDPEPEMDSICPIPSAAPAPAYIENRKPYFQDCPHIGSMKDYYRNHFTHDYTVFLKEKLASRELPLGRISRNVPEPDTINVTDAEIAAIHFTAMSNEHIHVEALLRTSIYLSVLLGDSLYSDTTEQFYKVNGSLAIYEDGYEYSLTDQAGIYESWDQTMYRPLSDYLVPILSRDELDIEAEQILRRYYPEALQKPICLNVNLFTKKLGLKVQYARITKDGSILGQLFFEDAAITVYDKNGQPIKLSVGANTILIDADAAREANGGRVNPTILHECVHFLLHRMFYRMQKIYQSEIQCFSCPVELTVSKDSPIYWTEWQANQMIRRLAMPVEPTRTKIAELISQKEQSSHYKDRLFIIESVIHDLAEFYCVSKQSARQRMVELGFPEAQGVLNFCNGAYVPNYLVEPDSLMPGQTYTVNLNAVSEEYTRNIHFRAFVDSGKYVYVESHFCLNSPKFVEPDTKAGLRLTDYARTHMSECCLVFDIGNAPNEYTYRSGTMKRETTPGTGCVIFYPGKNEIEAAAPQESPLDAANRISAIMRELPASLGATLVYHMKRLGITKEKLEELSNVSVSTIQRIRSKEGFQATLQSVIALCVGMSLDPELSEDMVDKAGYRLRSTPEHTMYKIILRNMYMASIDTCNAALVASKMPPLTKM
ncbi:MAG: hypothetical protein LUE16_11765 [Lachnospiraceae bacterium]|nr:hypothetical protein [Lachnospiraceae bacterium]